MATLYADSSAAGGGDGSIGAPLNALPSSLGSNDYLLAPGSTFAMGATQLSTGNNTTLKRWANGDTASLDPLITSTAATAFASTIASGTVWLEDVAIHRTGAQSGTGINCKQMSGGSAHFILRRCTVAGFNSLVDGERSRRLTIEQCDFLGSGTTYAVRGRAHQANNGEGWVIRGNAFDCGTAVELYAGGADMTAGAYNDLVIEGNTMMCLGTAMFLRGGGQNATDYAATASITGGNTLVRDPGSPVWPNWANGTVLFLAGWANAANFGTVTVTGGGGTRSVTVSNLGATVVNEGTGIGKGCAVFDVARSFNKPVIRGNVISGCGLTPIFLDNFNNGTVEKNTVRDVVATGQVAAAFEFYACQNTTAKRNRVERMTGSVTVDMMGLFWDGACVDCVSEGNVFIGIRPTTASDNAGAGVASYFSTGCVHRSNVVIDCTRGAWVGGVATDGTIDNNVFADCARGVGINSSPQTDAIVVRNNLITGCDGGIRDSAGSDVSGNAFWLNTADNELGALPAVDATAVTDDPEVMTDYRPLPGSPLLTGADLGYLRDIEGKQGKGFIGAYCAARLVEVA